MPSRGEPGPPPFRPFFFLGALDAILGVAIWAPILLAWRSPDVAGGPVVAWHARELLFGAFPAVISGFLLTALPRWTGRPTARPLPTAMLLGLWLTGPAALLLHPPARPALAAAYTVALAAIVCHQILRADSRRNFKILPLMALLAGAAVLDAVAAFETQELPFRMGVAASLGLVMVLGGRIVPALTAVHLERRGGRSPPPPARLLEFAAATTTAAALGAWVVTPEALPTAWLGAAAAACQSARCFRWKPWRTAGFTPLLFLHLGYACIPLGFALEATHATVPRSLPAGIALHVWAIGAIGMMSVAVMASMIRRHSRRPFAASAVVTAALATLLAAVVLRIAADIAVAQRTALLLGASAAWAGGHLLFLAEFARYLQLEPARSGGPSHRRLGPGGAEGESG